jgi:hypothetical protein
MMEDHPDFTIYTRNSLSDDFKAMLLARFPNLKPLREEEFKTWEDTHGLRCCACQHNALPLGETILKDLTFTHIQSSLILVTAEGVEIYILCVSCGKEIERLFGHLFF